MPNFNTRRLAPTNVARYPIPEITVDSQDGVPTLLVRCSNVATNDTFAKALAKSVMQRGEPRRATATPDATIERSKADRKLLRALYAAHVIVGWEDVCEADGEGKPRPVPFSHEACAELLAAPDDPKPGVPDDMFNTLAAFCGEAANFREQLDPSSVAKH